MTVKSHGDWETYVVADPPAGVPRGALMARRISDEMDWYVYVHNLDGKNEGNFDKSTVKFLVDVRDGKHVIRVPVVEEDRLFPAGCLLLEMMDIIREQNEPALIAEFANHFIDVETGEIGDLWVPTSPIPPPVVVQMKYRAKTVQAGVIDPGNGFIVWETAAQTTSKIISVSTRSDDNLDYGNYWGNPDVPGLRIAIQHATNAGQVQRFRITGVVSHVSWFELQVTFENSAGGLFTGNNPLLVSLVGSAIEATPISSMRIDMLEKRLAELEAKLRGGT